MFTDVQIDRSAALGEHLTDGVHDQRATAAYRREMVRVLTAKGLRALLG